VDVVGGGAGVAAQQFPPVFTHPTELHVVVVLVLHLDGDPDADLGYHSVFALLLEVLKVLVLCFPLDSLFFLGGKERDGRNIRVDSLTVEVEPSESDGVLLPLNMRLKT